MARSADPEGLLADRYLTLERRGTSAAGELWLGTDEVLGRRVAIRLHHGLDRAGVSGLTEAASRSGAVHDTHWVRVLDVGSTGTRANQTGFVVTEWVESPNLTTRVQDRAVPPPGVVRVISDVGAALAAAHEAGLAHGRLRANEVLVAPDSHARVTGLDRAVTLTPASERADLTALAALIDGAVPRRSRGRTARSLRALARRVEAADITELATLRRLLGQLPQESAAARDWSGVGRWTWRVVPPIVAVAVAGGAWVAGKDLGKVPAPAQAAGARLPAIAVPSPGTPGAHSRLAWSHPPRIVAFDATGPSAANAASVGLAVDDDPSTSWQTGRYPGAHFGGHQPGTGLLIDLGRAKRITGAQLLLSAAGADVQVRAANRRPARLADTHVVLSRSEAPVAAQLRLHRPETARYWLFWFTSLPRAGKTYQLGVAEAALLR